MRVLVQRVTRARVTVDEETTGEIGPGFLLLVGVTLEDTAAAADLLARKVANLRVFDDGDGNLNRSALDLLEAGEPIGMLVVSQFTLYADVRRGRRPGFTDAALPDAAVPMLDRFVERLRSKGTPVETGRFGADMAVELVNDGPFTLLLDSERDLADR